MAAADPQVVRVVSAHRSAVAQVRAQVERYIARVWDGLDSWREPDIARFVNAVVPVVLGGQRRTAALTDIYLATLASRVLGGTARPTGVRATQVTGTALRGVDPRQVYRRPGVTVWSALANGRPLTAAVRDGRTRALVLATTDLQLVQTHTARAVFATDNRVVGQRRVPSGGRSCGLCLIASTQRYRRDDLMPIHDRCSCSVEPIYGTEDPGQVIDPDRLESVHDAVAERFGPDAVDRSARTSSYRELLDVQQHGEVGPMLVDASHGFTGPGDI